jgi:hypothetical protein
LKPVESAVSAVTRFFFSADEATGQRDSAAAAIVNIVRTAHVDSVEFSKFSKFSLYAIIFPPRKYNMGYVNSIKPEFSRWTLNRDER